MIAKNNKRVMITLHSATLAKLENIAEKYDITLSKIIDIIFIPWQIGKLKYKNDQYLIEELERIIINNLRSF